MRNREFIAILTTLVFAAMVAVFVPAVAAQGYSSRDSSTSSSSPSSTAGPQSSQAGNTMAGSSSLMSAETQLTGSIVSISGSTVFVTLGDGRTLAVALGPSTAILERVKASLDSIRPGDALGVAATKTADGSLRATAINVFAPEIWQRVRKGQFPMSDGQVMTNAQVESLSSRVEGRVLYLHYEMLSAAILVPPTATITRSRAAGAGDLVAGMAVTIRGSSGPDGIFSARLLSFDRP